MSTVPEVLAAREEGLDVVVLSLVTNMVVVGAKEDAWVGAEVVNEVRDVVLEVWRCTSYVRTSDSGETCPGKGPGDGLARGGPSGGEGKGRSHAATRRACRHEARDVCVGRTTIQGFGLWIYVRYVREIIGSRHILTFL